MKVKFKLTFKRGLKTIAEVEGMERDANDLTVGDIRENVIATEQYLEKLTGLRLHIEEA